MSDKREGRPVQEETKALWLLLLTGAGIAFGKLLNSSEQITLRVAAGRTILGSATSLVAGMLLLQIPHIGTLSLLATGSALGIAGAQAVEALLMRFGGPK